MGNTERILIITGAGASYDCAEHSQRGFNWHWRPPLVDGLFEDRAEFLRVLNSYPGAKAVTGLIRQRVQGGEPFEEVLKSLRDNSNTRIGRHFLQVPLYLSDLFERVSSDFIETGVSDYNTLIGYVEEADADRAMLATVNYDCLLDNAVSNWYGTKPSKVEHYINFAPGRSYAKLHGCCRWMHPVVSGVPPGVNLAEILSHTADSVTWSSDILVGRPDAFWRFDSFHVFPAISVPVAGKTEFTCELHADAFRGFAKEATRLLIVGFSCRDAHIVEILATAKSLRRLLIVNGPGGVAGEPTWSEAALRLLLGAAPHLDGQLDHSPGQAILNQGFHEALGSGMIASFLAIS